MKLSLHWLRELCPPLSDFSAEKIAQDLLLHTAEVEETIDLTTQYNGKTAQANLDLSSLGFKSETPLNFSTEQYGTPLPEVCSGFADTLFDIDNKSVTHRPDLLGHHGFVRELCALYDIPSAVGEQSSPRPISKGTGGKSAFSVTIDTPHCRRFALLEMDALTVAPSPLNTQVRLETLGVRTISNIVDVTNLVLLEYGQPMHAFDADKIRGKITVRHAKAGETLLALDGEDYELTPADLVIADEAKVLSIAGIMGGIESSVTEDTTRIVYECANFDAATIRLTSARLGLRSESSMRFEKSLDPEQVIPALSRAVELTQSLCPATNVIADVCDVFPAPFLTQPIRLSMPWVRKISALDISDKDIQSILTRLGFQLEPDKNSAEFLVQVPSWRATKDVSLAVDLLEEIIRVVGIENVPETRPVLPVVPPRKNNMRQLEHTIINTLAAHGAHEVRHTSFVGTGDQALIERTDHIRTLNATNAETESLRQTLLSNFLRSLENEIRTHKSVFFFEIGKIYSHKFTETHTLGILRAALDTDPGTLFFQLKSDIARLWHMLGFGDITVRPLKTPAPWYHPHLSADIWIDDGVVGTCGLVHPAKNDIKRSTVAFAEINLETLLPFVINQTKQAQTLSEFPSSQRDLSIVVAEKVLIADIEAVSKKSAEFLTKLSLFDLYQDNEKLGKGLKNLAFHAHFQSHKRTLTHEEVEADFQAIMAALRHNFSAELRVDFDAKK